MATPEYDQFMALPVEARRQSILLEVATNREANEGRINLNNFHGLFFPLEYDYLSNERLLVLNYAGVMDTPIVEGSAQRNLSHNSQLFIHQTPREYFAELDQIAMEQHIDIEKVHILLTELVTTEQSGLYEKELDSQLQRHIDIVDELQDLLLPVYVELRVLGYNDTDLGVS